MKFSSTTLLALSFNSGAWFALGKVPISRYEMLAAGDGTEASPYGEVLSLDPFNGKVFIEAHNQTFGVSGTPITIELFANVTANVSCNEGTLLANSSKNSISTDYYKYEGAPAAYTPTTSDGIIGVADFSIQDFQGADVGIFIVTDSPTSISNPSSNDKCACPGGRPIKKSKEDFGDVMLDDDINCWDISQVTDLSWVFYGKGEFNKNLDCWDTSGATNMKDMFSYAKKFNQPLDTWDVSSVIDMGYMFASTDVFNQPIDSWNIRKVTSFKYMFGYARAFSQCLASWPDKVMLYSNTNLMFSSSLCSFKETVSNKAWCQTAAQGCMLNSQSRRLSGTYGTINLCVRTSIKMQIDGGSNYVSFVDSHLKVNVDLASDFKTFNQSVTIVATDAQTQEETIVKSVDVESFLCEKNGADTNTTKYKIGQDFSVCVRPTAGYISDYNVAGFSNVTCGYRTLISNGQVGPLTEVAAGNSTQGNVASFTSVVISGYFDGGQTSFTCSGTAVLSYLGRRLATSFSHAFLDKQDSFRGLQESTIPEEIPFATSIQLLNDNLDIEGIAAPAFTASHGGWNLFIVCAAVVIASVI